MQGIFYYIYITNHVSVVYNFAAILKFKFKAHIIIIVISYHIYSGYLQLYTRNETCFVGYIG